MLVKHICTLESDEKITYHMSSLFQGALMELLPGEYVDILHQSKLHPYTQHLEREDGRWYWVICALNEETERQIQNAIKDVGEITLKKHDTKVKITGSKRIVTSDEELNNIFYQGKGSKYFTLRFLTPTAFKRQGSYLFYPDIYCVFQSLMNKHDSIYNDGLRDEDTLVELTDHSRISQYKLRSTYFPVEGVKIPSFLGEVTIEMKGTRTMSNLADMLFHFGEYSGVGIKTAIGMGAMQLLRERERKKD